MEKLSYQHRCYYSVHEASSLDEVFPSGKELALNTYQKTHEVGWTFRVRGLRAVPPAACANRPTNSGRRFIMNRPFSPSLVCRSRLSGVDMLVDIKNNVAVASNNFFFSFVAYILCGQAAVRADGG